jgi:hypothetical protein
MYWKHNRPVKDGKVQCCWNLLRTGPASPAGGKACSGKSCMINTRQREAWWRVIAAFDDNDRVIAACPGMTGL